MWPPRWVRTHAGLFRSNKPCWCLYSYINTYNFSFKLKCIFCVTLYFGYNTWHEIQEVTRNDEGCTLYPKPPRDVKRYNVKYVFGVTSVKCWHLQFCKQWINVPYVPSQHFYNTCQIKFRLHVNALTAGRDVCRERDHCSSQDNLYLFKTQNPNNVITVPKPNETISRTLSQHKTEPEEAGNLKIIIISM